MTKANALEEQMLKLINTERAAVGAGPLKFNDTLNTSSEDHSRWMLDADKFSHTGEGNSSPHARMQEAGYPFEGDWQSGENIAFQSERGAPGLSDDVIDLHDGLMDSPGHRENILNPEFTEIGIGIEQGDFRSDGTSFDSVMVSQNFARSDADTTIPEPPVDNPVPAPDEVDPDVVADAEDPVPVPDEVDPDVVADVEDPVPAPDEVDPDVVADAEDPVPVPDEADPDVVADAEDPDPVPEEADPDVVADAEDPDPVPEEGDPDVIPVASETPTTCGGLFDMLFGGNDSGRMPDSFFFGFTDSEVVDSDGGTWTWTEKFVFTPDQNGEPDQIADQGHESKISDAGNVWDDAFQMSDIADQVNSCVVIDSGFDCGWG